MVPALYWRFVRAVLQPRFPEALTANSAAGCYPGQLRVRALVFGGAAMA